MGRNPHAVALGRLGASAGGLARARVVSPERRREIARTAAAARWAGALPDHLAELPWSKPFRELRLPDHQGEIFGVILTHGGREHRDWLRRRWDRDAVADWIRAEAGAGLSVPQMRPWLPISEAQRLRRPTRTTGRVVLPDHVKALLKSYEPGKLKWGRPLDRYAIVVEVLLRGFDDSRRWLASVLDDEEIRSLIRDGGGAGLDEPARATLRARYGLSLSDLPAKKHIPWR